MVCCMVQKEICKECGKSFGSDEAKRCIKCNSFICPQCGQCNCYRVEKFPIWLLNLNEGVYYG